MATSGIVFAPSPLPSAKQVSLSAASWTHDAHIMPQPSRPRPDSQAAEPPNLTLRSRAKPGPTRVCAASRRPHPEERAKPGPTRVCAASRKPHPEERAKPGPTRVCAASLGPHPEERAARLEGWATGAVLVPTLRDAV